MKNLTRLQQKDKIAYIENTLGLEEWTYLSKFGGDGDISLRNEWVLLVKSESMEKMRDLGHRQQLICCQSPGFSCSSKGTIYHADVSGDECENIVNYREFYGLAENRVELSQEFVLLFNLLYDASSRIYYAFGRNGEKEEVVVWDNLKDVRVKTKYLRRYTAAKQLYTVIGIYYREDSLIPLTDLEDSAAIQEKNDIYSYDFWYTDLMMEDRRTCSILQGQKNIAPLPVEKCGIWPYNHKPDDKGEAFIIGVDENGENIYSEPLTLDSYPCGLRPIFFKKEVLHRYLSEPEVFTIEDGILRCGCLWSLEIDAEDEDYVNVYLRDLARSLPFAEHKHWAYYNVPPMKRMSEVRYMRDVLAEFADSKSPDFKFKQDFERFQQKWKEKYGWSFYRELHEGDQYHYTTLLASVLNNQQEFDARVLNLCIILVDYLNEAELGKMITIPEGEKNVQGLKKLKLWSLQNGIAGFEVHYDFLHSLYQLRSKGSGAHRKSTSYDAALSKFRMNEGESFKAIFNRILQKADAFALFMLRVCCDEKAV